MEVFKSKGICKTETARMKLTALSIIRHAVRSHTQALFNLVVMPVKN